MSAGAARAEEARATCTGLEAGPQRTVVRVIDAETIALDNGEELRLIGALAPRAGDAGAEADGWPLEITAREELRALVLGRTIEMAFSGEKTDRYGRLQAHVFVPEGNERRWVQGHLLEQGLARAYTTAGNRACADALLAAERVAAAAGRGLWSEAAYRPLDARRSADLLRARATFQIVEGVVVGVAQVRGMTYLNFDRNWRRAFSVALPRRDRELLGGLAREPKALEGRRVRVRGWIGQRSGAPSIDLSVAGLIEVLPDTGPETKSPGVRDAGR